MAHTGHSQGALLCMQEPIKVPIRLGLRLNWSLPQHSMATFQNDWTVRIIKLSWSATKGAIHSVIACTSCACQVCT